MKGMKKNTKKINVHDVSRLNIFVIVLVWEGPFNFIKLCTLKKSYFVILVVPALPSKEYLPEVKDHLTYIRNCLKRGRKEIDTHT